MNVSEKVSVLGFVGVLIIVGMAVAVAEPQVKRESLDTDGDGFISQVEWDAGEHREGSSFADRDTDADGRISQEEFDARKRKDGRERVRRRDK